MNVVLKATTGIGLILYLAVTAAYCCSISDANTSSPEQTLRSHNLEQFPFFLSTSNLQLRGIHAEQGFRSWDYTQYKKNLLNMVVSSEEKKAIIDTGISKFDEHLFYGDMTDFYVCFRSESMNLIVCDSTLCHFPELICTTQSCNRSHNHPSTGKLPSLREAARILPTSGAACNNQ